MHWGTILRNVFSNWVSYFITAAIGFLLAPFILHRLGNTGYGLWTLVLSLTGYFGLLDLGIRSSVGRFVARHLALNDDESVNRTITTAFSILACGGMLALLGTIVVVRFFFSSLHVEPQYQAAGKIALLIAGLNMAAALPLGVFSSVLVALDRFDLLSGVTIIGELARAALVVVFLKNGFGLVALALIALAVTISQYTVMAILARHTYAPLKLRPRFVHRETLGSLFGFGIHRFIAIVANQLIFYSDSLVIGIYLGAGAITSYAIAGSLINYGRNVVSLLTDTFYPAATRMDAKQDLDGLRELLFLGTKVSLLIALPLCMGFVFLGRQFISLWMGSAYASSAVYLGILAIPQFTSMPQYVSSLILAGMARHRMLAYLALGEGVLNLALSIVLVQRMGVLGVAWGTVVPHLVVTGILVPAYTLRVLGVGVREYLVRAFLRPVIAAVPIVLIEYAFSVSLPTATWAIFIAEVLVICSVYAIMSYFLCFTLSQREAALGKLRRILQRETVQV